MTASKTPVATPGDTGTVTRTITQTDIDSFAALTGDANPLHTDVEYAEQTQFNGQIVHGTLIEGLISAALAELPGTIIYLDKELQFNAPVRPGNTVTARAIVTDTTNSTCTVSLTAETRGETVITGTATVQSNPEPDSPTAPDATPRSDEAVDGTLHFDGASRGNPGEAATGIVVTTATEEITDGRVLSEMTNNEAEYNALIDGLETALDAGITHLTVKGDSELVIRQVTGEYDCNASNLQPHLKTVRELLAEFDTYELTHVTRDNNSAADGLANETLNAA